MRIGSKSGDRYYNYYYGIEALPAGRFRMHDIIYKS